MFVSAALSLLKFERWLRSVFWEQVIIGSRRHETTTLKELDLYHDYDYYVKVWQDLAFV